jgi:hypothetical protein
MNAFYIIGYSAISAAVAATLAYDKGYEEAAVNTAQQILAIQASPAHINSVCYDWWFTSGHKRTPLKRK